MIYQNTLTVTIYTCIYIYVYIYIYIHIYIYILLSFLYYFLLIGHEMKTCKGGFYCEQCKGLTYQPNSNKYGDQCRLR